MPKFISSRTEAHNPQFILGLFLILSLFAQIISWERENGDQENSMHSPVYFIPTLEGSQPTLNWKHTFQIDGSPFLVNGKNLKNPVNFPLPPQRNAPILLSDNHQNVFGFFRGINPAIPENNDLIMSFDLDGQQKWTKKKDINRKTSNSAPTAAQFDSSITISKHKFLSGRNTSFYPLYLVNSKQSFRIFDTTTGILFAEFSVPQISPGSGSSNPVVYINENRQNLVIFGCGSTICGFTVESKIFTLQGSEATGFSYDQPIAILTPADSGDPFLRIIAVGHISSKTQENYNDNPTYQSILCSLAIDPKTFKVLPQFSWKTPFYGYLGVPTISSTLRSVLLVEDITSTSQQRTFAALLSNGTFVWENNKGTDWGHLQPVLSLGNSTVYAITDKGEVFAFNLTTGLTKWRKYVGARNLFSPVTVLHGLPFEDYNEQDIIVVASNIDDNYYLTALEENSDFMWEINGLLTIPQPDKLKMLQNPMKQAPTKSIGRALSPVAVGSDGSLSFSMIHSPIENKTQNFATVVSTSQIHIASVQPNHFYLLSSQTPKERIVPSGFDVNIFGDFARLKPSFLSSAKIECFFEIETSFSPKKFQIFDENKVKTDYFYKVVAKYVNSTMITCSIAAMPQEMLVVGKSVNLILHWYFPTPNQGKLSNFFSNQVSIQFYPPPQAYKMFPIGVPYNLKSQHREPQEDTMISVFGLGFEQGLPKPPQDFVTMCKYEYKTSTVQYTQYQRGKIISDKQIDCLAPEIMSFLAHSDQRSTQNANYALKMYFSVDFDESTAQGVFFKTPYDLYLYQNPVVDSDSFSPRLVPMDSGTTVSFVISGEYLNQFQIQNNIKCGFSTTEDLLPPDSITPAKCIPKRLQPSETQESAFCQCKAAKFLLHFNSKFHFWFSLNGVSFNRTSEIIEFYRPPIVTEINPKEGNITSPTLCKVTGDHFFDSDGIFCKFGDIGITRASFSNFENVFCAIPLISELNSNLQASLKEAGKLIVPVTVSENGGIDYSPNVNNITFTYLVLEGCGNEGCGNGVCRDEIGKCKCYPMWAGERCQFPEKEGYWIYIGAYLCSLVFLFIVALAGLVTYLRKSEMKYWKLIEETQANDISMIF